jgi:tRNA uridine 5-carboxymethylaminomethyl modification enzyme
LNADATGIQFRLLNASKGPSVRSTRVQCDKKAYQFRLKATCERQQNLDIKQGHIADLIIEDGQIRGVATQLGVRYQAKTVVVTTGTFLQGLLHVGLKNQQGGRMGDAASGFSAALRRAGFELERLKTGTPPRLNRNSIDFSQMQPQPGDEPPPRFSFVPERLVKGKDDIFTLNEWRNGMFHVEQLPCWMTYTTPQTHEIIRANLDKSPMYCGVIEGVGPRYCPSIEDKVVRFADKERHQIFLEPEGRHTDEFYINGCSTSLPFEVQAAFIQSIPGLEKAEIMRSGYAVEYDFAPPQQLQPSLETKIVSGLFFAGQINGTSGYEEAGAQGLIAGINAARKVQEKPPLVLKRHEAYIGVLIDDLVTKGTKEPYRMFTSRAEHRLLLRQDNADLRLTQIGRDLDLVDDDRFAHFQQKHADLTRWRTALQAERHEGKLWIEWLRKNEFSWKNLPASFQAASEEVATELETEIKYSGYLERELHHIARNQEQGDKTIPSWIDYQTIPGLKAEARIKLQVVKPQTFGQASRISGINPTDIALLHAWSKKGKTATEAVIAQ